MQRKRSMVGKARRGLLTWPRLALGLALLALGAPSLAQSQSSAYTVTDINVNRSAASGQQAREMGLAEAREAAFTHLFERLVPSAYHGARPNLPADQMDNLIQSVDVVREQVTATSYRADLTMSFSPPQVRAMLSRLRIPYTDRVSPPLLIVPVYEWAGARQLWEIPNPWHSAWVEQAGSRGLISTVLAKGDAGEQLMLSADQAVSGDSPGLQRLAQTYQAGGAVVALGQLRVDPRNGRPVLDVTLQGYGAAPAGPLKQRFEGTAAAAMVDALADAWKAENLQRTDLGTNSLTVSVPLSYIGDYATALRMIGEVNALESATVSRISAREARFQLRYRSDLEQVRRAFSQYGMQLVQEPGGWVLRVNG